MKIPKVVMKFGGSSVGDDLKIRKVAEYVARAAKKNGVVVVVSAMGKETDRLIKLARAISPSISLAEREMDRLLSTGEIISSSLLAMVIDDCFGERGRAVSLSGPQLGLETDLRHGGARIKSIRGINRVERLLDQGKIPVISGFQGVAEGTDEVTTFGRGGGDLSAIAVAGELGTGSCKIFTDVDGVYTIDPRLVPEAKRFTTIGFGQALQLAGAGARVLMDRSILLGQNLGVRIEVLLSPSFGESSGGTLVCSLSTREEMENSVVETGIAVRDAVLMKVSVPNVPGIALRIHETLSEVKLIESFQGPESEDRTDISLLLLPDDFADARAKIGEIKNVTASGGIEISAITLVCPLIKEEPDYLYRVLRALALPKINVEAYYAASSTVLVLVKREAAKQAALALGKEFDLLSPGAGAI